MNKEVRKNKGAAKPTREKRKELLLGPLPVAKINAVLEMELVAGDVIFSVGAQVHAERRHPKEFLLCLPYLLRNPRQSGHRFRRKAVTDSDRKRPANPNEGGHPVDRVRRGALSAI